MSRENRKHTRRQLERMAWIKRHNGSTVMCIIKDISEGGARLCGGGIDDLPDHFVLSLSVDHKVSRPCRVVRRAQGEIGVLFSV
jgi:hypothetical protein